MYYRSLNAYLRETFGCKVYKLALSAGCTCPNRDGRQAGLVAIDSAQISSRSIAARNSGLN